MRQLNNLTPFFSTSYRSKGISPNYYMTRMGNIVLDLHQWGTWTLSWNLLSKTVISKQGNTGHWAAMSRYQSILDMFSHLVVPSSPLSKDTLNQKRLENTAPRQTTNRLWWIRKYNIIVVKITTLREQPFFKKVAYLSK